MDAEGFYDCINLCYHEVCKKSDGLWLLVIDNCGGHESETALSGVRIELFLPRTTTKYQSLDLSLIAHSRIRYLSLLLRTTIKFMLRKHAGDAEFPDNAQQEIFGLHHGFLPTVGNAMELRSQT